VYLQITRGNGTSRDHAIPNNITPTIFAMASPIPANNAVTNAQGIVAITQEDFRWERCDIKAVTLLANVLLKHTAMSNGGFEAILIRNGFATEGAASNLFIVRQGCIITPPTSQYLLPGITRDLILELAAANGLTYAVESIPANDLTQAEEIWLTSSVREIMPVVKLNNQIISHGKPGLHWQRVNNLYQTFKANLRAD
jgi:D-alanine transaminase